jgi:hypothetical protein
MPLAEQAGLIATIGTMNPCRYACGTEYVAAQFHISVAMQIATFLILMSGKLGNLELPLAALAQVPEYELFYSALTI